MFLSLLTSIPEHKPNEIQTTKGAKLRNRGLLLGRSRIVYQTLAANEEPSKNDLGKNLQVRQIEPRFGLKRLSQPELYPISKLDVSCTPDEDKMNNIYDIIEWERSDLASRNGSIIY